MNALVYSSSLAAAFLGGVLALFAPCCVVSLLPTFVGAALERGRLRLPAMAAIFAAGIATVMLPIVLGVGLLGQLLGALASFRLLRCRFVPGAACTPGAVRPAMVAAVP